MNHNMNRVYYTKMKFLTQTITLIVLTSFDNFGLFISEKQIYRFSKISNSNAN